MVTKKGKNLLYTEKGFTLIEILVASTVFLIIISITSGIFVSLVGHQKRAMAYQELLSQTSYVIEYMGRALRMAKRATDDSCLSVAGLNYENPGSDTKIKFINRSESDICQEFSLNGGQLEESKDGGASFTPLTSDKFQINSLKFELSGESGADTLQPRVTIFLEIQVKEEGEQPKIQIQTTISQMSLDI